MIRVGDKIGKLTVVEEVWIYQKNDRKRGYRCECDCGNKRVLKHRFVLTKPLIRGVHSCGCGQLGVPRGPSKGGQKNNGRQTVVDPTPAEIAAACLEVQRTWTEEDFVRRRGGRHSEWEVPIMSSRAHRDATAEFS